MTLDEVKNIRKEMQPEHDILTDDICWAIDWLLDALRLAESQAADVREAAAGTAERYGYAMRGSAVSVEASQTIADAIRALPLPAPVAPARTYEDGVRDAAAAAWKRADAFSGGSRVAAVEVANVIDALLSPAPAVALPAAPKTGPMRGGGGGAGRDFPESEWPVRVPGPTPGPTTPAPSRSGPPLTFDAPGVVQLAVCGDFWGSTGFVAYDEDGQRYNVGPSAERPGEWFWLAPGNDGNVYVKGKTEAIAAMIAHNIERQHGRRPPPFDAEAAFKAQSAQLIHAIGSGRQYVTCDDLLLSIEAARDAGRRGAR